MLSRTLLFSASSKPASFAVRVSRDAKGLDMVQNAFATVEDSYRPAQD